MLKINPFTTAAAFSLLLTVTTITGCASDRAIISQANQVHDGIKPAVMDDAELTNYLQKVGDRIIAAAREYSEANQDHKWHQKEDSAWMFSKNVKFHFVNSKTINAFTTGGEHMYIYSELFQKCRTEDELAAVMAHEFAHIYGRHVHKGMNRQYGILGAAALAGATGAVIGGRERGLEYGAMAGGGTLVAGQLIGKGFTRKDEDEADSLGFAFYTRAGYDPQRFGDFFQQMIDMGFDKSPELLSDHPSLASRVEASKRRAAELPVEAAQWRRPPVAGAAKFKLLQARADQLGKSLPSDETLASAHKLLDAFGNCFMPGETPQQVQAREELAASSASATESEPSNRRRKNTQ